MFEAVISAYRWFFLLLADFLGYGWAIVALSCLCSALMAPLMRAVAGVVRRESEYQSVILPQVAEIKAKYASDMDRHLHVERLYKRYGYSPLSPVKKVLPLFVQIPFLLLTYCMLKDTAELSGVSFLFLKDLGAADALLPFAVNLLPFVMTGVNLVTVFGTPGFTVRDQIQAIAIALLFLVMLYTAPSALLLYWTLNNAITMVRTLAVKKGEGVRLLCVRFAALRNVPMWLASKLTVQRLEASSLAFVLISVCMWLLIYKEVWFFNCYISRFLVCPTLFAALAFHALALRCERGRFSLFSGALFALSAFAAPVFALVLPCVFVAPVVAQAFTSHVDPLACSGGVLAVWLVVALVVDRSLVRSFLVKCCGETHWLLFSVAIAIHYSFSSALVKLPIDSVFTLAVKLVVPAAVFAAFLVGMFAKRLPAEKTYRVGIAYCTALYLVPMISLESGKLLSYHSNFVVRLAFIGLIVFVALRLNKRKPVVIAICLLLAMTVANAVVQQFRTGAEHTERAQAPASDEAKAFANADLARSNSVYLLVYDSYPHDEVLADLGIDKSRIKDILLPRGFTRYDAYSVGSDTVQSMGNSLAIGDVRQGTVRSMMAGNNPLCDFLKRFGYGTSYLLCAYDMPGRGERMPGDFYFPAPQKVARLENVLLDCILRGYLSQAANTFNSYSHDEWADVKSDVLNAAEGVNSFVYVHNELPGHAIANVAYRKSENDEIAAFTQRLVSADKEIEADVDAILRKKDDSLIIVASDHGAFLKLCDRGDYGRLDLLDRCGIQLYVRWPKGYKPTLRIGCLSDVFLETFICLSGDKSLARFQTEGISLPVQAPLKAPYGAIRKGVVQFGRDAGQRLFGHKD